MHTLIDGSALITKHPTGVSVAARDLLKHTALPINGTAEIVTCRQRPLDPKIQEGFPYPWKHKRIPSKIIHTLCGSGVSSLDRLFGPCDRLLLPNMNIVGRPRVPYDLLIHDISFLLHPQWFSYKTRAWHALAQPRRLIREAERLFTVSAWTKRDLIEHLGIPEERITIVDIAAKPLQKTSLPRPIPEPYALLFSAQDVRKNALCAELAFLTFVQDHPDWKLVLVGAQGPSKHPNILHQPYLEGSERVRWLQHARALLYPSWYEGYGLPPQEAAWLNVPCLAAGSGVIAETAPKGTVLLPAHVPSLWAEALRELVD